MTSQTIRTALYLATLVCVGANLVAIACTGRENQRLRTHVQNLLDSVLEAYKIIAALAERVALLERAEPAPGSDAVAYGCDLDGCTICAVPCGAAAKEGGEA
ncbi:MAG: hypothetical protein IJJ51_00970 [Kiritimatiellae bacterium]|nr:hypothetical protein [Kiritimatiellia bacterium]